MIPHPLLATELFGDTAFVEVASTMSHLRSIDPTNLMEWEVYGLICFPYQSPQYCEPRNRAISL